MKKFLEIMGDGEILTSLVIIIVVVIVGICAINGVFLLSQHA